MHRYTKSSSCNKVLKVLSGRGDDEDACGKARRIKVNALVAVATMIAYMHRAGTSNELKKLYFDETHLISQHVVLHA